MAGPGSELIGEGCDDCSREGPHPEHPVVCPCSCARSYVSDMGIKAGEYTSRSCLKSMEA